MKRSIIYEVALTGNQHNFYTLYRHAIGQMMVVSTFIQNLSINFDEACQKAGGKWVFKMVDENNHIYFGSSSNIDSSMLHIDDFTNTWFKIAFTPSLYEGKVYVKRIKMIVTPIDIKEGSIQIETSLYHKKDQENFSKAEAELLERISKAIDMREQINKTQLV